MSDTTGDEAVESSGAGPIDEVAYKLEDWDDEAFVDAEEALREAGVAFRREGFDTIVVAPGDEELVDRLLDEVEASRLALVAAGGNGDGGRPVEAVAIDLELTRWCPECGAEYLPDVSVCPDCGVPLEDRPAAADPGDHEELIYELVEWSPEMRNQLTLVLEREGIAHEWEGDDLVVAAAVEAAVDGLIDQIEQGEELPEAPEEADDEADYNVISDLFVAADRLAGNPDDLALCGDFVDAAGPAQTMSVPFGVDETAWRLVQQQVASLVDAIDQEEPDEMVGERARVLRDLLRGYV